MSSSFLIVLWRIIAIIGVSVLAIWLLVKLLMGLGWLVGMVGRGVGACGSRLCDFAKGMLSDAVRLAGGAITAAVFVPMVVANVAMGRWSRANHYGRALEREVVGVGTAAWRLALGHPARLIGLSALIEGVERRIPEAVARAPGPDRPSSSDGFDGYTITGALPSGGSGARLFLAEPTEDKRRQLARTGLAVPEKVVIKSFSMSDGSSMPQIVRESRALEAARNLGLVLEHALAGTRFHYVMPYVPGEDLHVVTQRLHAECGPEGLGDKQLRQVMDYTADLLGILHRFHANGLWHKDVKPNNIIVSGGRVQLVDLGLITPLTSAMTLTTHGTEYFRDPEMVRLALRGVKVHEVDGVKFDVFGVGAVLYSMIENSFPAHGSLSQTTRRCPDVLRWIVRRAMADMANRYASTTEMLADLRAVMSVRDPFSFKPAQLPSMNGRPELLASLERELQQAVGLPVTVPAPRLAEQPRRRERGVAASGRRGSLAAGVIGIGLVMMGGAALFLFTTLAAPGHAVSISHATLPPGTRAVSRNAPATAARQVADRASHRSEPSVLLLIDDVPAAASDTTRQWVDARLSQLEQARFELVGGGREHSLGAEREIALRAEVLKSLALADPRDPEAQSRLSGFLAQHAGELDGLLWIGRDADSPDRLAYHMLTTSEQDDLDVRALLGARHAGTSSRDADASEPFVYSVY